MYDFVVVGSGFAGAVSAARLADAGFTVLVVEKRSHVGGLAYDCVDASGVLIHPFGPHIFHTNDKGVFEYLSKFTNWRFYEHRVLASVDGKLVPIPINRTTLNRLYDLDLDEKGVGEFLERVREPRDRIETSEDVVLSNVGPDLCEKFFRGYTRKQWGLDLSELDAGVAARIPTRTNDDDRYFTDDYQFMPENGYTALFENMLSHSGITVRLNTDYSDLASQYPDAHVIYTGEIDRYYRYRFGRLPYRSLRFDHRHLDNVDTFQPVGTVNYPNDHQYTRITEFKHLTGQIHIGTSIVYEYPTDDGPPFYPIPRTPCMQLYQQYKELAAQEKRVTFVGRLAEYRYLNMDAVVRNALDTISSLLLENR